MRIKIYLHFCTYVYAYISTYLRLHAHGHITVTTKIWRPPCPRPTCPTKTPFSLSHLSHDSNLSPLRSEDLSGTSGTRRRGSSDLRGTSGTRTRGLTWTIPLVPNGITRPWKIPDVYYYTDWSNVDEFCCQKRPTELWLNLRILAEILLETWYEKYPTPF